MPMNTSNEFDASEAVRSAGAPAGQTQQETATPGRRGGGRRQRGGASRSWHLNPAGQFGRRGGEKAHAIPPRWSPPRAKVRRRLGKRRRGAEDVVWHTVHRVERNQIVVR